MLIGFSAENYRSFKDELVVSFLASNYYKENSDTLLAGSIPGLSDAKILPVTAIYGPNASGKSTVLAAVREMRAAVLSLRNLSGNPQASYSPFLLDGESASRPTTFSIEFCTERRVEGEEKAKLVRYEYSFSYSDKGIVSENLRAYFSKMPRKLFSRTIDDSGNTVIEGSATFPIANEIKPLIGSHMLVLSFFSQADKSSVGAEASVVTDWFRDQLAIIDRSPNADPMQMFSGEILDGVQGTDYQRALIRRIMSRADAGLASVDVERLSFSEESIPEVARKMLAPEMVEALRNQTLKHVSFKHQGKNGAMEVPEESSGTMQLFALSGYVAQALERGGVLMADEIDASLHPDLANEVVSLFLDKSTNRHNAQLVFTAHNPSLMNNPRMRRDEFWIAEKNEAGASRLYPISDFKAKKGESIQAAYLQGRYEGLPIIPACFGMCGSGSEEAGELSGQTQ